MGQRTPDTSYSQLQHQSSSVSGTASPRMQCSTSSSEECLPLTLTPSPTASSQKLGQLSEEAKAELIAQLASDPEAVSLMREVVSKGETTGNSSDKVGPAGDEVLSLNIGGDPTISKDEVREQSETAGASSYQANDDLLSPPIEFKSLDPSKKMFFQRQTSTTSTQTDEEMSSLSLTQAAAIASLASSRETGSTSGYDSNQASFTQGERDRQALIYVLSLC